MAGRDKDSRKRGIFARRKTGGYQAEKDTQNTQPSVYDAEESADDLFQEKEEDVSASSVRTAQRRAADTEEKFEDTEDSAEEFSSDQFYDEEEEEKRTESRAAVQAALSSQADETGEAIEKDERNLKQILGRSRLIWVVVTILVLLVVFILIFFSDRLYNWINGTASYVLVQSSTVITNPEGTMSVDIDGNQLIRCSQDGVQALDADGNVIWDIPFTMSSPSLVQAGDYISVADQLGMSLVTVKDGAETCEITTENTIIMNTVNEIGQTAVVLSAEDGHMVDLYAEDGSVLLQRRTYSAEDGIPMGVALNADGTRMATIYVNYSGTSISSILTVFDLTESGSSLVDRILGSVTIEGSLISDIKFVGSQLFYIGTEYMGAINTTTNTDSVWQTRLSYQIESLVLQDDYFAVRYGEGLAGTAQKVTDNIVIYNYSGEEIYAGQFENATYLDAQNGTVIVGSERSFTGLSSSGHVKWTLNAIEDYSRLLAFDNGRQVAALKRGQIDLYDVTLKSQAGDSNE